MATSRAAGPAARRTGGTRRQQDVRAAAARVVLQVLQGRSLSALLPEALPTVAPGEQALLQELCYGTLRWAPRLQALAGLLLQRPLKERDRDVAALLLVGLYQLLYLQVPAHAAVQKTVEASGALHKNWARGLLNATLRRLLREREDLLQRVDRDPAAALAHPQWLLERLRADWPQHWQAIAQANNERPPMTLRVNAGQGSRADYLQRLQQAGIDAADDTHGGGHAARAITLQQPVAVERLPGFFDGAVSVQDGAAQLAAPLLRLAPGQRVLDACAAPGGKTGHLLEQCPGIELLALDSDNERLGRVHENLARLRLQAAVRCADASDPPAWWDGRPFDRMLLDAPCTGTGVIRRHPDIKLLRRADDIPGLAARQAALLHALWPLLAPGGMMLYATCSVLQAENSGQITAFLQQQADAIELPIDAGWGHAAAAGRQILPGENEMDGFYYALLQKS